ncbi:fasciclin domain-containing protein [Flavobacterium ardleyense]|uniref:Fasciclin domain-containing protein n=1 Tax=Flavobacterium ardleyense TaxID=2038737 RepID=A0ABW5ZC71_9FLAO
MKNYAKLIKLTLLVVTSSLMFSCSDDDDATQVENNSISAVASRASNLSILVSALEKTDLVSTLDQPGPYTVFAPTNAAFTAFLTANGYDNLDAVPTPALKEILLNHVVSGSNLSTSLTTGYIKTLAKGAASSTNTLSMFVNTESGVRLNGVSSVATADIVATNGVIHIVDAVIGLPTVVTHAAANPNFSTLVTLLSDQDLVGTLNGTSGSPFTVFAPINSAFDAATLALYGTYSNENKTAVLTYHVVAGVNVLSTGIPTTPIETFQGQTISIAGTVITDQTDRTTDIVAVDVQASNGVVHAINKVLLPAL